MSRAKAMQDERPQARATPSLKWAGRCGRCGTHMSVYLLHYQKIECPGQCGLIFWALEPKRDEPLKLYVHPESR